MRRSYIYWNDGSWTRTERTWDASKPSDGLPVRDAKAFWLITVLSLYEDPLAYRGTAWRAVPDPDQWDLCHKDEDNDYAALKGSVYHIKEVVDLIESIHSLELPPSGYYEILVDTMVKWYPKCPRDALEHLAIVEQLLDVAIAFGISFSAGKLQLLRERVALLGEVIHRQGRSPDPRKCEALRAWPPVTTLKQLQDDDAIALSYGNNPNGSVSDIAGITLSLIHI